MWPKAVVPRAVERQLLVECREAIRDDAQTSSAFVLDSSNPALNHRQTPVFPQSTESMPNPMAMTPSSESLLCKLRALVGDEVSRPLSSPSESSCEESPYRGRRRRRAVDSEAHYPSREVVKQHGVGGPLHRPIKIGGPVQHHWRIT